MVRVETRKVVLMIGLGIALLLICIGVVFVIDTHFSLDPWGDGDVGALWYFLVGSIFFPGALRRYRAGRQRERKVPWYHRLDLILCLIGLVCGLVFALSVVQKWVESILMRNNSPVIGEGSLAVLAIAVSTVTFCWIALVILLFYQMIKQIKQGKTEPPQTT
jgi:hypothetical protein